MNLFGSARTTPITTDSMDYAPLPRGALVISLVLSCFALSQLQAQCPSLCDSNLNTAVGDNAFNSSSPGSKNTAIGHDALHGNTTGIQNTAVGYSALTSNMTGRDNTATGAFALEINTTGFQDTADGSGALANNNGNSNTAIGFRALFSNTSGGNNTATGVDALQVNTGSNNTAYGELALANNKGGSNNIGLGIQAGQNLTTGSNNIDIGNAGVASEANTIRIGKQGTQKSTSIAGISGVPVTGSTVVVNSTGKLGVATSSARFKEAIKPMDKTSEAILALKPVTFRYKKDLDPEGIPQFGLVAEDVEKVNPDLVARDAEDKVYTVRYEAVNAMLLNEFLKAHRTLEEQQTTIERQQKQIEALSAGLQKVTARLESHERDQRVVSNQ